MRPFGPPTTSRGRPSLQPPSLPPTRNARSRYVSANNTKKTAPPNNSLRASSVSRRVATSTQTLRRSAKPRRRWASAPGSAARWALSPTRHRPIRIPERSQRGLRVRRRVDVAGLRVRRLRDRRDGAGALGLLGVAVRVVDLEPAAVLALAAREAATTDVLEMGLLRRQLFPRHGRRPGHLPGSAMGGGTNDAGAASQTACGHAPPQGALEKGQPGADLADVHLGRDAKLVQAAVAGAQNVEERGAVDLMLLEGVAVLLEAKLLEVGGDVVDAPEDGLVLGVDGRGHERQGRPAAVRLLVH
mmetsp:Transcript_832/g.2159  ORF Transcript_832/g.2159 Transcript_832/m.2159 type:complete len:301 (+) Transcript_832:49-951(+)